MLMCCVSLNKGHLQAVRGRQASASGERRDLFCASNEAQTTRKLIVAGIAATILCLN